MVYSIRVRLGVILMTLLLLTFGLVAVQSKPASAGVLCDRTGVCGRISHQTRSDRSTLTVTCNLADPWRNTVTVARGKSASCKDDDAFWVPKGCRGWINADLWYSSGPNGSWVKVQDKQSRNVSLRC